MALLEMDHEIMEGIKRAGYSHVICTLLNEKEASAVEHESEDALLKFIPVKSINDVSAYDKVNENSYSINLETAEQEVNKVYSTEMSVRFFIEGRYAC